MKRNIIKSILTFNFSIKPMRVRSGWSKAALPTTLRGLLSVMPNTNLPPPLFAKAQQHFAASLESNCFFASLNWTCSPSLASRSSWTVSKYGIAFLLYAITQLCIQ